MHEYHLMRQGHERQRIERYRGEAAWVSWLVTAASGQLVTTAQILGEENPHESPKLDKRKLRAAARKIERMEKKYANVMGGR